MPCGDAEIYGYRINRFLGEGLPGREVTALPSQERGVTVMLSQYDTAISAEWREVCSRVKQGLKKLGHDIPLCAHSSVDELREMRENRKAADNG